MPQLEPPSALSFHLIHPGSGLLQATPWGPPRLGQSVYLLPDTPDLLFLSPHATQPQPFCTQLCISRTHGFVSISPTFPLPLNNSSRPGGRLWGDKRKPRHLPVVLVWCVGCTQRGSAEGKQTLPHLFCHRSSHLQNKCSPNIVYLKQNKSMGLEIQRVAASGGDGEYWLEREPIGRRGVLGCGTQKSIYGFAACVCIYVLDGIYVICFTYINAKVK